MVLKMHPKMPKCFGYSPEIVGIILLNSGESGISLNDSFLVLPDNVKYPMYSCKCALEYPWERMFLYSLFFNVWYGE